MHCPPDRLSDLVDVLEEVRSLPKVVESKPGIFYLRRTAFLHFHLTGNVRSADIRCGKEWGPRLEVQFGISGQARADFVREVRRRYEETLGA